MANIFGINFARELNLQVTANGGFSQGTLVKFTPGTRTPGDITGGTNPTSQSYTFTGFLESREVRRTEQVGASQAPVVSILGDSLTPPIVPEVNDEATIEGKAYLLIRLVARDGGAGLYEFEAQEK